MRRRKLLLDFEMGRRPKKTASRRLRTWRPVGQQEAPRTHPRTSDQEFLSRSAEAEAAYVEYLDHARQRGLLDDRVTIGAMHNLGSVYEIRGRGAEAAALYAEALVLAERVLGPRFRTTLLLKAALGGLRMRQGLLEDADALLTEAMDGFRETLGLEHDFALESMETLAILRERQGRITEAEGLYRELIAREKQVRGERHLATLGTMTNFGQFLLRRGRPDEAREMLETTLPIKREEFGNDHLFTRIAMGSLADTYEALDRRADALPLRRELLEFAIRTAERDGDSAANLNNVAWELLTHDYEELHDPPRAIPLAERAKAIGEANGGEHLWMYLDTLALAQHMNGDTAAAIENQRRAIELAPEDEREELNATLAKYEAALAAEMGATDDDHR